MNIDTQLSSYNYNLPDELIAARPAKIRDQSKLLYVNVNESTDTIDKKFCDIVDLIPSGSLIIMNQSKVFPCRILAQKTSGAKAEIFFLSTFPDENNNYKCLIKSSRKKKIGDRYTLPENLHCTIQAINDDETFMIKMESSLEEINLLDFLNRNGLVPIPPYIRNANSDEQDKKDYQTVFASNKQQDSGSVAAPTAGLHFTVELIEQLQLKKIDIAYVTLHVGLGTFRPIKSENILDHKMHIENFSIDERNFFKIKQAFRSDNRLKIFVVGTTSLRVIETICSNHGGISWENFIPEQNYQTDIFIHPGKQIFSKKIFGMITNFHLPQSSLLVLISALIGRENVLQLYKEAIEKKYRFFSYGDAMFIDNLNL